MNIVFQVLKFVELNGKIAIKVNKINKKKENIETEKRKFLNYPRFIEDFLLHKQKRKSVCVF